MTGNYHRKLSASIYHHAKNVGIIGILAYPKIYSFKVTCRVSTYQMIYTYLYSLKSTKDSISSAGILKFICVHFLIDFVMCIFRSAYQKYVPIPFK